jgi:hypothetical protein
VLRCLNSGCQEDCGLRARPPCLDRVLFVALTVALVLVLVWSIALGWSHLASVRLTSGADFQSRERS